MKVQRYFEIPSRHGNNWQLQSNKLSLKTTAKKGNSRVEVDVKICTKTGSVIAWKTLARAQFRGLGTQSTGLFRVVQACKHGDLTSPKNLCRTWCCENLYIDKIDGGKIWRVYHIHRSATIVMAATYKSPTVLSSLAQAFPNINRNHLSTLRSSIQNHRRGSICAHIK